MKLLGLFAWIGAAVLAIYYGGLLISDDFKSKVKQHTLEFYLAHAIIWSTIAATIGGLFYLTLTTFNLI